jgi:hypothetical protein
VSGVFTKPSAFSESIIWRPEPPPITFHPRRWVVTYDKDITVQG